MFAKMFARTVEASLHRGNAGLEGLRNLGMTTTFLHQGKQGTILGSELRQRVPQGVQFLGIDRAGRLGNVFVLLAEREKNSAQFLPAQLVDAGVAREPEKPRFKLGGRLQTVDRSDHLDEHLLRQVLHIIASAGHGVHEPRHPMLIADHKFTLGALVALLSPPHEVGQGSR